MDEILNLGIGVLFRSIEILPHVGVVWMHGPVLLLPLRRTGQLFRIELIEVLFFDLIWWMRADE